MKSNFHSLITSLALVSVPVAYGAVENTEMAISDVSYSISSYYSQNVQNRDSAYFESETGFSLSASLPINETLTLAASVGAYQTIDGVEDELKTTTASIAGSFQLPPLSESLFQSGKLSLTLPTNEDQKIYDSFLFGLNGSYSLSQEMENWILPVSLAGSLSYTENFYEYDTNKGRRYNGKRFLAASASASLKLSPKFNLSGSVTNISNWKTDNSKGTDLFAHSLSVTYAHTDRLSFTLTEGLRDRTFEYDEVSSNIHFYDDRLTVLTGSVSYTL